MSIMNVFTIVFKKKLFQTTKLICVIFGVTILFWCLSGDNYPEFNLKINKYSMGLEARDNAFFLDGKQLRLISGAMHYFRVVPEYWRDRMLKIKACGLNCLETYVPWNWHEEVQGEFNFEGILNVRKYIQMAQEVGLYVIFRPGPFICSEWEFGGLPSWLLNDPGMKVRSSYKPFIDATDKYFTKLFEQVVDLQYSKGGPIIAFQIENEYGSYGNDMNYKMFLKNKFESSGLVELFFTSDNGVGIQIGEVPGTLITANFQEKEHGYLMHEYLANVKQPGMPFMVMEFWTGWFDHWGEQHHIWPTQAFETVFRWILSNGGSCNFYMFHGGTNFGFMAGANEGLGATNEGKKQPYQPDVTSYDYDAPISEHGELTPKWYLIRDILKETLPDQVGDLPEPPEPIPTKTYGKLSTQSSMAWHDVLSLITPISRENVQTMESLNINNGKGQGYGMTLYRSTKVTGKKMTFPGQIHDRAVIYINGNEKQVIDFNNVDFSMTLTPEQFDLDLLVENLGRVNYAEFNSPVLNDQRKGLRDVQLDGKSMKDWQIYPLEFKKSFLEKLSSSSKWVDPKVATGQPGFHKMLLHVDEEPCDTFINMKGWTKGIVFVNHFNLGRYWNIGPQQTLYIPGPLLRRGDNEILIFELHTPSDHVTCDDRPDLGQEVVHETEIPELKLPGVNA